MQLAIYAAQNDLSVARSRRRCRVAQADASNGAYVIDAGLSPPWTGWPSNIWAANLTYAEQGSPPGLLTVAMSGAALREQPLEDRSADVAVRLLHTPMGRDCNFIKPFCMPRL